MDQKQMEREIKALKQELAAYKMGCKTLQMKLQFYREKMENITRK